jgi:periplasmic divalent cation tolerance protein
MAFNSIYVTTETAAEAIAIGKALVGERLAACANVIDGVRSLYWWEGAVADDGESVLILKTRSDLVERLTERVKELHGYDCPCVVALPIVGGNSDYLDWIAAETAGGEGGRAPAPCSRPSD